MNTILLFCVSTLIQGAAPAPDLSTIRAELAQIQKQAAVDRKAGKTVSRAEVATAMAAVAEKAVAGVDLRSITDQQAADWMPLFQMAHRPVEAGQLAKRAATYHAFEAWTAEQVELQSLVTEGKGQEAVNVLRYAAVTQVNMLAQLAEFVHGEMTAAFIKTQPKVILDAYDALLVRMDPSKLTSPEDRKWADICYVNVMLQRYDLLFALGRKSEALTGIEALRTRFAKSTSVNAFGGTTLMAINRMKESWGMVHSIAPEIVAQHTIGSFSGLASLKGKVVVLDFFAHWCVPCKRAFPELRDFYSKFRGQGMELVGVTSLYGYYGSEQGLSPDREFAKLQSFTKEMSLTWPIAVDATKRTEKAYGVGAIPQLVVIDRKGMIRMVQTGYEPEKKAVIEAELTKLLAEKA